MDPEVYFFTGKGGTGKSTCSAIFAVQQSNKGKKVFINSIDPAHNLSQIFGKKLSDKSRKIENNLYAQETDLNIWKKKYLTSIEDEMRITYKHQTAFNLNKYFRTLKYSPGLEEYVIILAIEDSLKNKENMDMIIFDTPPTALFLNFISLPYSSLKWLEQLFSLRALILKKRETINRIHKGKKEKNKESDEVLEEITGMISRFKNLSEIFQSKKSHYMIVMNPDSLSFSESHSIMNHLGDLGIPVESVILNKYEGQKGIFESVVSTFDGSNVATLNKEKEEIIGLKKLKEIQEFE
jgi:arsenite-transporting ATPase